MTKKLIAYIVFAVVLVLGIVSLTQGIRNALNNSQDFQWSPIKVLAEKKDPYTSYINGCIDKKQPCDFLMAQAPNYPTSGLGFLFFFGFLSFSVSKIIWVCINIALSIILPLFIFKILLKEKIIAAFKLYEVAFFVLLLWASLPFRNGIGNGQHALYSFTLFILSYYYQHKNRFLAAVFLAASWLKYTITIPLTLIGLSTKKISVTTLIIAAAISLLEYAFFAYYTHTSIIELIIGPLKTGAITTGIGYIDIFSLAKRVFNFTPQINIACYAISFILLLLLLRFAYLTTNKTTAILWGCIGVNLLIFHNVYDFSILIFPVIYLYATTDALKTNWMQLALPLFFVLYIFFVQRVLDSLQSQHVTYILVFALFYYAYLLYNLFQLKNIKSTQNNSDV